MKYKKQGFTLIEMLVCTVILSIITISVLSTARSIQEVQVTSRNRVYLSTHQLNVMEQLRQRSYDNKLLAFYEDYVFSTSDITTYVQVEEKLVGDFYTYYITITSEMDNTKDTLTNSFVLTDIGQEKISGGELN